LSPKAREIVTSHVTSGPEHTRQEDNKAMGKTPCWELWQLIYSSAGSVVCYTR